MNHVVVRGAVVGLAVVAIVGGGAGVGPAAADTIGVTQKHRYWSDNSVYYEYGPFRDAHHCISFAQSNPALAEQVRTKQAFCSADTVSSPWRLTAPINIL